MAQRRSTSTGGGGQAELPVVPGQQQRWSTRDSLALRLETSIRDTIANDLLLRQLLKDPAYTAGFGVARLKELVAQALSQTLTESHAVPSQAGSSSDHYHSSPQCSSCTKLQQNNDKLRKRFHVLEVENDELRERLSAELDTKENVVKVHREEYRSLQQRLAVRESALEAKEKTMSALQLRLQLSEKLVAASKGRIEELTTQLNLCSERLQAAKQTIEELKKAHQLQLQRLKADANGVDGRVAARDKFKATLCATNQTLSHSPTRGGVGAGHHPGLGSSSPPSLSSQTHVKKGLGATGSPNKRKTTGAATTKDEEDKKKKDLDRPCSNCMQLKAECLLRRSAEKSSHEDAQAWRNVFGSLSLKHHVMMKLLNKKLSDTQAETQHLKAAVSTDHRAKEDRDGKIRDWGVQYAEWRAEFGRSHEDLQRNHNTLQFIYLSASEASVRRRTELMYQDGLLALVLQWVELKEHLTRAVRNVALKAVVDRVSAIGSLRSVSASASSHQGDGETNKESDVGVLLPPGGQESTGMGTGEEGAATDLHRFVLPSPIQRILQRPKVQAAQRPAAVAQGPARPSSGHSEARKTVVQKSLTRREKESETECKDQDSFFDLIRSADDEEAEVDSDTPYARENTNSFSSSKNREQAAEQRAAVTNLRVTGADGETGDGRARSVGVTGVGGESGLPAWFKPIALVSPTTTLPSTGPARTYETANTQERGQGEGEGEREGVGTDQVVRPNSAAPGLNGSSTLL